MVLKATAISMSVSGGKSAISAWMRHRIMRVCHDAFRSGSVDCAFHRLREIFVT